MKKLNASDMLKQPGYNPNGFIDAMLTRLNLRNDAELSRALEVSPPVISKIRHRQLVASAPMLVRLHEMTGLHIRELRSLMGINQAVRH